MPKRSKLSRRARRKALTKGHEEGKALLSSSQKQKNQELDEDYEDVVEETTEQSPAPPHIVVEGASPTAAFASEGNEMETPEDSSAPSSASKSANEPILQEETSGHRVHFANNHQQQANEGGHAVSPSEGGALRRGSTSFHRSRQAGKSLELKDISTPRTPKGTTVDTIIDLNLQIEGLIPMDVLSGLTPPSPNKSQEKNVGEELSTSTSPRVETGLQITAPASQHDLRLQIPEEEIHEAPQQTSPKASLSTGDKLVNALDNKSHETISAVEGVIGDRVKPAIDSLSSRFGIFQQKLDENLHLKALVIYFIIACDALSFTVLEPVLPLMVESRMGIHETVVGNYVGLVIGAFSAAQFLTTPFYGYLSDTLGRKVFVVISLFTSMICLASLGFVTNVYMAILIRFIQGFFNSANALSKAYLIDISSAENRTTLLAYLGAAQALSRSITAGFGGLSIGLLTYMGVENPYLLPCLVGALLIGVSLYLSFNLSEQPRERADSVQRPAFWAGVKDALSERIRAITILLFALSHFGNGASLMLLVLVCEESIKNYGFGLQNWQTGFLFMLYGLGGFAFQMLIFRKMVSNGLRMTYFIGSVLSAVQIILLPFVGVPYWLNNNEWSPRASLMVWALLIIDISIASVAKMVLIPVLQIIMANATEPEKQGLVQGVSMSLGVLFKAIGPAVCGALFTISINRDQPYLVFLFTGFVYFVCSFIVLLIPASLEHPKERGIHLVEERIETTGNEQGITAVEPPATTLPYKVEGEGVSLKLQTLEA